MATANPRPRAHLLRELNSTRHSSTSSRHSSASRSSFSDFDPENEAIMSTRQLDDVARKLPELRASAKKYQRPHVTEPEYAIDTSALAKAFPDFSQGSLSGSSDISIEIGRGAGSQSRGANDGQFDHSEFSSIGEINIHDDSLTFKAPVNNPRPSTQKSSRDSRQYNDSKIFQDALGTRSQSYRSSGLRNEVPGSPAAKSKDYGSSESRKSSESARRTLSAMHAKARVENDQSNLAEDRPPTVELTTRSTRFNATNAQMTQLPTKFGALRGFQSGIKIQKPRSGRMVPSQLTQGSFQLPEMPNVSELVSGVFEDGTPVYSRHGKSRITQSNRDHKPTDGTKIEEVPVPVDEQAIFLSLKLLEDRVSLLEREKAELEINVKDLENKNVQLESERNERQVRNDGSDSALGLADSDYQDDLLGGHQSGRAAEKQRLAASVKSLKYRLNTAERKVSTTENIIRNITQERDAAVSQLGVAYVTIEQLKAENESCRAENEELQDRIEHMNAQQQEKAHVSTERVNAIRKKVADFKEAQKLASMQGRKQDIVRQNLSAPKLVESAQIQPTEVDVSKDVGDDGYDELFDLTPRTRKTVRDSDREEAQPMAQAKTMKIQESNAVPLVSTTTGFDAQDEDCSQAFTELSYINTKDIESMRRALETERQKRKEPAVLRTLKQKSDCAQSALDQASREDRDNHTRRSSAGASGEKRRALSTGGAASDKGKHDAGHERRRSESSIMVPGTRRRGQIEKNMTSAFIIPDITIGHQKLKVPKPIPVSERLEEVEPYEDEATIRPSQPPGLALATVIKAFEEEIGDLKKQLAKYQEQYNSHDPALSKRRRKYVFEKMENILKTIDAKSDQLYSLYDVLEGQKQSGQELTQEELDITLQSVGIETSELELLKVDDCQAKTKRAPRQAWDLASENSADDELPWEGIETTVETTRTGSTHGHRRRGSRF